MMYKSWVIHRNLVIYTRLSHQKGYTGINSWAKNIVCDKKKPERDSFNCRKKPVQAFEAIIKYACFVILESNCIVNVNKMTKNRWRSNKFINRSETNNMTYQRISCIATYMQILLNMGK